MKTVRNKPRLACMAACLMLFTPHAKAQAPVFTNLPYSLTTLVSFTGTAGPCPGADPHSGLIQGNDGNFYGTTAGGGPYSDGTVFQITSTGSFASLFSFSGANGMNPVGGLAQGSDGYFYGTTAGGGSNSYGSVYRITSGGSLTTLYSFDGVSYAESSSELIQASDGNFYGTAFDAVNNGPGGVFKITPSGSFTPICVFNATSGGWTGAGLVQAKDGNFYGATTIGGSIGFGTLFQVTPSGSLRTLCALTGTTGCSPDSGLIQGTDGNLYGVASEGGTSGAGTVFMMTTSGSVTVLFSIGGTSGKFPEGGLIQASDGNFYGTTDRGGSNDCGTIFSITPGGVLTNACSFTGANGANPTSKLVQGKDGHFYGTTGGGGASGCGTVFQLITNQLTTGTTNGVSYQIPATGNPSAYQASGLPAGLSLDPATGLLSGTPTETGTFSVNLGAINASGTGNAMLTVVAVSTPNITSALNLVINDGAAFSYQITALNNPTSYGAGNLPPGISLDTTTGLISGIPTVPGIFSIPISATNANGTCNAILTVTVSPNPVINSALSVTGTIGVGFSYQITAGNGPQGYAASGLPAGLSLNRSTGLISGTPQVAGTYNATISASNASGTGSATLTITVLSIPVITGNLTASGADGFGFNYQISAFNYPASYSASGLPVGLQVNTFSGLISGTPRTTGTFNVALSAINASGTGTANLTINLVLPPPPTITDLLTLCTFNGPNGAKPYAGVIQASDGNFYGTTSVGGTDMFGQYANDGIVFKLTPDGVLTTLHAFTHSGDDGAYPYAGLMQAKDGNLFGTTSAGGTYGDAGIIFRVAPGIPSSFQMYCSFTGENGTGFDPWSGLVQGNDGNFYGTTVSGGSYGGLGAGTFYRLTPYIGDGVMTTLRSFMETNGDGPFGGIVQGSDGNFYGTTQYGGSYFDGTIFRVTSSGDLTTLCSFNGLNGQEPFAGLMQGSDGCFYGTTIYGGNGDYGVVFRITSSGSLATVYQFDGTHGAYPYGGLVQGDDGNFYGTTSAGGNYGQGTVYQLTPSGSLTTLHSFTGSDGASPKSALFIASNGNLYGTTYTGGQGGSGTVFETAPNPLTTGTVNRFNHQIIASNHPTGYNATGLPAGLNVDTITGSITGTATETGTFNAAIYASNDGGTASGTMTIVVLPKPVITSAAGVTASTGAAFSYQIAATGSPTGYFASGLPAGLTLNSATGLISGVCVSGTYDVTIGASNLSGTGSATLTITVLPIPVITSGTTLTGTIGAPLNYQITATNNPASYTASGLPAGLNLDGGTGLISGTPAATGTFDVTIQAINGTYNGNAMVVMNIVLPPPPVITSSLSTTGTSGYPFKYLVVATNNPASFGAEGLPAGLGVDTATGFISGTPAVSGTFSIDISAENLGGTDSKTLVLAIAPPPPAPVITSGSTAGGYDGTPFSYQITATNNPTGYGSGDLPAGLILNAETGLISGIPTVTGTYSVPISATNPGGTGSSTLTISLVLPSPPVIQCGATRLYSFSGTSGSTPYGTLIQGSDGNFYGTTSVGGASNLGTAFKITSSGSLTTLGSLAGSSGSTPHAGVVQGTDGNFYGTASYGGSYQVGTIYRVTSSGSLTRLYSFNGPSGEYNPNSALSLGNDGYFYGITNGGLLYKMSSSGSLTFFPGLPPLNSDNTAGLIQGTDYNFYGTTARGGSFGTGSIFRMTRVGSRAFTTTLFSFSPSSTGYPLAGLIQGTDGCFYGTTLGGGTYNRGTVFKMTPSGSFTTLANFSGTNGSSVQAGLIQGTDGNFYGTTYLGGINNFGTVFRITSSGSLTSLYSFDGTIGAYPMAALVQGIDGNFYGTASSRGGYGSGSVFKLVPPFATAVVGVGFSYQITATNFPTSYGAIGLPPGLAVDASTGLISGTPSASGTFSVNLAAANPGGSSNLTLPITVAAGAPLISTPGVTLVAGVGNVFDYQIQATNNPISYNATGLPPGLMINRITGRITGTPTVSYNYLVTISGSNQAGNRTATLPITVLSQPLISNPSLSFGSLITPFNYQISAGNNPVGYNANGLPPGLSLDPSSGIISGTPSMTGTFGAIVSTSYSAGYTETLASGIIINDIPAPEITSPGTATATRGSPFSYQITASYNPTSFSATGLPDGLITDTGSGLISGTPTQTGTFNVTITAANSTGLQGVSLTIVVQNPFDQWQQQMFTDSQRADPTISGDTATPAGDGITNLMKYALNLSPLDPGTQGLPVSGMTVDSSNNQYLTLSYTQVISAGDITYTTEVSSDMQTWYSGSGYTSPVSVTNNPDGKTRTVVVQDLTPVSSAAKRFIRLKVTKP